MIGIINSVAWWFSSADQVKINRVVSSVSDLAVSLVLRAEDEAASPSEALGLIRQQLEAVELQLAASDA